jgi:hypothetical protein
MDKLLDVRMPVILRLPYVDAPGDHQYDEKRSAGTG